MTELIKSLLKGEDQSQIIDLIDIFKDLENHYKYNEIIFVNYQKIIDLINPVDRVVLSNYILSHKNYVNF